MVKSMTGYAQAQIEQPPFRLRVTLKSVNHRFLDLHLRLPAELESFEIKVRRAIQRRVSRGHVEVSMQLERLDGAAISIDRNLVAGYVKLFRELREQFGLTGEPDLVGLLRLPGVANSFAAALGDEDRQNLDQLLDRALDAALARLDEMRREEGRTVEDDFRRRLGEIRQRAVHLAELAKVSQSAYVAWLENRLKELLGATPLDSARLAQEAALLAERSDVSEEISRLSSHLAQLDLLLQTNGEVGKKIDFLLQEMNREANTILSKTPGLEQQGLEMTTLGLEVKAEIEKLREQAQNIE